MNLEDSKKKETVRISKKDLLKLLSENEHMTKQITELQTRMTELVEENRQLKRSQLLKTDPAYDDDEPFPQYDQPFIDPNIYFDGAHRIK